MMLNIIEEPDDELELGNVIIFTFLMTLFKSIIFRNCAYNFAPVFVTDQDIHQIVSGKLLKLQTRVDFPSARHSLGRNLQT